MTASTLFLQRIVAIALCCLLWLGMLFPAQAQSNPTDKTVAALDVAPADAEAPLLSRCDTGHLGECVDRIVDNANDALIRLLERVPQLILALLVLLFASWISRFIANRLHLIKVRSKNPYMSGLLRTIVRTAIMLVAVLIALDLIGLTSVVGAVLG
ncbi:MAG: hypothetical protein WAZ48_06950, partial [Lysobacteraceae bacterium]